MVDGSKLRLEEQREVGRYDVLFHRHGAPCVVIHGAASAGECEALCKALDDAPWPRTEMSPTYRQSSRCEVVSSQLAQDLWRRLAPVVREVGADFQRVSPGDSFVDAACASEGDWRAIGINPRFRGLRYGSGDHFAPHRDDFERVDEDTRSFYTVILYCAQRGSGGRTLLLDDGHPLAAVDGRYCALDDFVTAAVDPRPGDALVFFHGELHAGEPAQDLKLILRTDLLFARESKPQLTDDERLGLQLYEEASRAEANRDFETAQRKYARAYRLHTRLADEHGM